MQSPAKNKEYQLRANLKSLKKRAEISGKKCDDFWAANNEVLREYVKTGKSDNAIVVKRWEQLFDQHKEARQAVEKFEQESGVFQIVFKNSKLLKNQI